MFRTLRHGATRIAAVLAACALLVGCAMDHDRPMQQADEREYDRPGPYMGPL